MRYEFYTHPELPGWFQVTDTKWMLVVSFKANEFNETQRVDDAGALNGRDAQTVATAMSELGDWLFSHHYSDIFPAPTYELRRSHDDSEIMLIGHKTPRMVVTVPETELSDLNELAESLEKAAQFLRKRMKRYNK